MGLNGTLADFSGVLFLKRCCMTTTNIEKNAHGISLILAAGLLTASTFYWQNGEYSVPAATLLILSIFFWIPAFIGLFGLFKRSMPRYAVYGLWIAVFGCISGICFAFLGYLASVFNISHLEYLEKLSAYPFSSQLWLFASGPAFPGKYNCARYYPRCI